MKSTELIDLNNLPTLRNHAMFLSHKGKTLAVDKETDDKDADSAHDTLC